MVQDLYVNMEETIFGRQVHDVREKRNPLLIAIGIFTGFFGTGVAIHSEMEVHRLDAKIQAIERAEDHLIHVLSDVVKKQAHDEAWMRSLASAVKG
jgi:hypothetical protein